MKMTEKQEQAAVALWRLANGDSGQCRYVAGFLLGIYHGQRFPFDLTDFRCLDDSIFIKCMEVLLNDHNPDTEIHMTLERLLPAERIDFEALARDWEIGDS